MSDTANHFDGEAQNVVQAGSAGHVYTGATQHVGRGMAVQGDFTGDLSLTFGGDTENGPASRPGSPRPREDAVMSDLIAFLRARLHEDEAAARAATPGAWRHDPNKHQHIVGTPLFEEAVFAGPRGSDATCVAGTGATDDPQSMADAHHIARHHPARALREIEAKRRIIDEHQPYDLGAWDRHGPMIGCTTCEHSELPYPCRTVRLLAIPYAEHPDYREEWAL